MRYPKRGYATLMKRGVLDAKARAVSGRAYPHYSMCGVKLYLNICDECMASNRNHAFIQIGTPIQESYAKHNFNNLTLLV